MSRGHPFVDLRPESEPPVPADPDLFLGRFPPRALRRELESAGILNVLAQRGYPEVVLRTDRQGGEHRLRILPPDQSEDLMELRVSEATCLVDNPIMRKHGLEVLYLLSVLWFVLQNPSAAFTSERPRLPGQRYPGLGFGRRVYGRLMAWAHEWEKDGLLNFPEYYHNAVFYFSLFRFLSPRRQGRLEALRRDLGSHHVCDVSAAVMEGRVREEPGGQVLQWERAEMVAPVTRALRGYLDSADYRSAARQARESVSFRLS